MRHYSPKTKLYATIAIVVFIFLSLLLGGVLPLINKIHSLSSQYVDTKQQIINIEDKRNKISTVENEYRQIKDSVGKINGSLIDPEKFLDVIIKLEQMAEQTHNRHDIVIIDQDSKSKKSGSQLKYLALRIALIGSFQDSIDFMNTLENSNFYSRIDKVEMVKASTLSSPNQTQITKEADIKTTLEVKIFTNQ